MNMELEQQLNVDLEVELEPILRAARAIALNRWALADALAKLPLKSGGDAGDGSSTERLTMKIVASFLNSKGIYIGVAALKSYRAAARKFPPDMRVEGLSISVHVIAGSVEILRQALTDGIQMDCNTLRKYRDKIRIIESGIAKTLPHGRQARRARMAAIIDTAIKNGEEMRRLVNLTTTRKELGDHGLAKRSGLVVQIWQQITTNLLSGRIS